MTALGRIQAHYPRDWDSMIADEHFNEGPFDTDEAAAASLGEALSEQADATRWDAEYGAHPVSARDI